VKKNTEKLGVTGKMETIVKTSERNKGANYARNGKGEISSPNNPIISSWTEHNKAANYARNSKGEKKPKQLRKTGRKLKVCQNKSY
jgi:hypothetical protein